MDKWKDEMLMFDQVLSLAPVRDLVKYAECVSAKSKVHFPLYGIIDNGEIHDSMLEHCTEKAVEHGDQKLIDLVQMLKPLTKQMREMVLDGSCVTTELWDHIYGNDV